MPKHIVRAFGIEELVGKIQSVKRFGFDTESHGPQLSGRKMLNVYRSSLTGFSLAFEDGSSYYVPVGHLHGGNCSPSVVNRLLRNVMDTPAEVWAHNWKHDFLVASMHLGTPVHEFKAKFADTMLLMWLLGREGKKGYGLKDLGSVYLGRQMGSFEELTAGRQFCELTPEEGLQYATDDAEATLELAKAYAPELASMGVEETFWNVEMPFVQVLLDMERVGMRIDSNELSRIQDELAWRVDDLKDEWAFYSDGVDLNSPKQLATLYEAGVWPTDGIPKGKSGQLTTNADAMKDMLQLCAPGSLGHVLASIKLEYQACNKLLSTYTGSLIELAEEAPDGRIHASYLQHGTATGRLSCNNPNLQNLPRKNDKLPFVRNVFVPGAGSSLFAADYSQIELRVLAHLASKGKLAEAYRENKDIHQQTADLVGCTRQDAKVVNFLTIYGGGPKKLAKALRIDQQRASEHLHNYHKVYPEVEEKKTEIVNVARQRGFIRTLTKRFRRIPELRAADKPTQWRGERLAMNTPIQGTAADILKLAMLDYHKWLIRTGERDRVALVATVHDEIVGEAREDVAQEAAAQLKKSMETCVQLRVPLVAEPVVGKRWGELK